MTDDYSWRVRGIRGATTVDRNDPEAIIAATRELLDEIVLRTDVHAEEVASAWFPPTRDLAAEFPTLIQKDENPRRGARAKNLEELWSAWQRAWGPTWYWPAPHPNRP